MKSMSGTDDESNLILLTPRENFLAHWLLWKIHRNRQTAYAFYSFVNFFVGHNHKELPKVSSSRGYQEAREAYSAVHKERLTGVLNSNRSKVVMQYDMDGNFIQEWPSAKEVQRSLGISHVADCCRGERLIAGNYIWKYKNGIIKKSKPYKKRERTLIKKRTLNEDNIKRISEATLGRKWYNNGEKDFFLKRPIEGLVEGRLATRKHKNT